MKAEAGARRNANLVHRHDAEHHGAGRIADAVDDDALASRTDARILCLVLFDIAAMVACDAQVRMRDRSTRAKS
jgi:hypothetical protein